MEKSFSYDHSTMGAQSRSGAISSRQKFENVEKLTTIVNELQQTSEQTQQDMPGKVLDAIKDKIKNNYDKLYDDYEANKKTILKNIQMAENNRAGEDALKVKFDNVIKEKNHFDRFKDQIDKKQRKLKKMIDVRDQIREANMNSDELLSVLQDRIMLANCFEEHKKVLDYETAVLNNMKMQRKKMKLILKQRQSVMVEEQAKKKERVKQLKDGSKTKKIILDRIEAKIQKAEGFELPEPLTEQLQKKLEEYEGKYSHLNILRHENKITKKKLEEEKEDFEDELKAARKKKDEREKSEKREFEKTYNNFMLKQIQEEKIKKLCGVEGLSEISENNFEYTQENLESIRQKIDQEIEQTKFQMCKVEQDIKTLMTTKEEGENNYIHTKEKELQNEKTQLRRLKVHMQKKGKQIIEWESCIQSFLGSCDKKSMGKKLKSVFLKYQRLAMKEKMQETENMKMEKKYKYEKLL